VIRLGPDLGVPGVGQRVLALEQYKSGRSSNLIEFALTLELYLGILSRTPCGKDPLSGCFYCLHGVPDLDYHRLFLAASLGVELLTLDAGTIEVGFGRSISQWE
jgi:hypothetical protein